MSCHRLLFLPALDRAAAPASRWVLSKWWLSTSPLFADANEPSSLWPPAGSTSFPICFLLPALLPSFYLHLWEREARWRQCRTGHGRPCAVAMRFNRRPDRPGQRVVTLLLYIVCSHILTYFFPCLKKGVQGVQCSTLMILTLHSYD